MPDSIQPFRDAIADPTAAARAAKAAGRTVVGYLTNTAPVELIEAAGAFPVMLTGGPGPTPLADRHMEAQFDPILRAAFERMLEGSLGFVDAVLLTRTADSAHRLYYYLTELSRMSVAELPEPLLFDLLHTPWYSSAEYNMRRARDLARDLARIGGRPIDEASLAAALQRAGATRDRLSAIVALRRAEPPLIGGEDALAVFRASQLMARDDFDAAADALLAAPPGAATGRRIVVAGSPLDRPDLARLIADLGGQVVGDYHGLGELMIGAAGPAELPPMRALVERYHRGVFSTRTFPQDAEAVAKFAAEAGAAGVVFYYYAEEEALTWEYPAQRRALEAAGIASVCFEDQPYAFDEAQVRPRLAPFMAALGQERAA